MSFLLWLLGSGRVPVLLLLLLVTGLLAWPAWQIEVEQDNRSMVTRNPQRLADYEQFRSLFGNDEDLLLSLRVPQLLSREGLAVLSDLTARISALDGVARVWSLSNARYIAAGSWGAEERAVLPDLTPASIGTLAKILAENSYFEGLLISRDRQSAGLVISLQDRRNDPHYRRRLINDLRQLQTEDQAKAQLHLTGVAVQKNDIAAFIQKDQQVILPLVVVVLALILALVFRHPSGVILPLATTAISLIWTMGSYALAGLQLNTITSLLPPVVMVLAVSNCVHLYNAWLHLRGAQSQRRELLAEKVCQLFLPCFFTTLTTALGLFSLSVSQVPAVEQFGLFSALGVCCSFVVSMTLVPIWLSYQRLIPMPRRRDGFGLLRRALEGAAALSIRFPRPVLMVALVLSCAALAGIPHIRNNTDLVGFLKQTAPLAVDTRQIEGQFGGVNLLEFMVSRQDQRPLTSLADIQALQTLEILADAEKQVSSRYSILTLLRPLYQAQYNSLTDLPIDQEQLDQLFALLNLAPDQHLQRKLLSADQRVARISLQLPSMGSQEAVALATRLQHQGEKQLDGRYRLTPTGSFFQIASDSNHLVSDLLRSFLLSLSLVMLSILVLLRSLPLTLLAMIPNLVPILWAVGAMGYAGIDLSTGTAMIGAVVIGLAVDDSIHYLVHYRRVFGGDVIQAVRATTTGTGRALTISSFALAVGFWVGCFGSFWPTIYFSLLVGGTLIAALLCDLLLLPACLILYGPKQREIMP